MSATPNTPAIHDENPGSPGVPALPGPVASAQQPVDIDPPRDIGWALSLAGAIGVMLAAWLLFGQEVDAMWAGYWASFFGTVSIIGSLALRGSLWPAVGWVLAGASGAGLILVALVQGYDTTITLSLIAGGAAILAGVGLNAAGRRH